MDGVVTAVAPGHAIITAKSIGDKSKKDICEVVVAHTEDQDVFTFVPSNPVENTAAIVACKTSIHEDACLHAIYDDAKENTQYQVIAFGNEAFSNVAIKNVIILENIETIGDGCFYKTEDPTLENIKLPSTLVNIGETAFCNTPLNKIYFPKSVVNFGTAAFRYSTIRNTIFDAESGIETISSGCFEDCLQLTNVILQASIKKLNQMLLEPV